MTEEELFTKLNPDLVPIIKEAKAVYEAMDAFREEFGREPWRITFHPRCWQAGILEGYCGLKVAKSFTVRRFELE